MFLSMFSLLTLRLEKMCIPYCIDGEGNILFLDPWPPKGLNTQLDNQTSGDSQRCDNKIFKRLIPFDLEGQAVVNIYFFFYCLFTKVNRN